MRLRVPERNLEVVRRSGAKVVEGMPAAAPPRTRTDAPPGAPPGGEPAGAAGGVPRGAPPAAESSGPQAGPATVTASTGSTSAQTGNITIPAARATAANRSPHAAQSTAATGTRITVAQCEAG